MIEEKGTKKTTMSAVLGLDSKTIVEVINEKNLIFWNQSISILLIKQ